MPIEEIGIIAKKNNICYMVDGAQSAGVYDIDVKDEYRSLSFSRSQGLLGPQDRYTIYRR